MIIGHMRSGNHFLKYSLEKNFENDYRIYHDSILDGALMKYNRDKIIYIFRDGRDVLTSLYAMKCNRKIETLDKELFNIWINPILIRKWFNHVLGWLRTDVYHISYNDLKNNGKKELEKIEKHFNLKRKNKDIEIQDEIIGVNPGKGEIGNYKNYWNNWNLYIFEQIKNEYQKKGLLNEKLIKILD